MRFSGLIDYRDVDRAFRSHRLGRHVRACRRRLLRHVFPQVRAAARRRRRLSAAHDRPQQPAERHQSLDRQIYLSRRLHPGTLGSAAGDPARAAVVTDVEILQLHYAETLKAWRERFLAHREEVERLYDRRFVRMWEFYLASSEMAFRESDMVVFQIQMTKRKGVVPQTRDYIAREEARLRDARSRLCRSRCASPANSARIVRASKRWTSRAMCSRRCL